MVHGEYDSAKRREVVRAPRHLVPGAPHLSLAGVPASASPELVPNELVMGSWDFAGRSAVLQWPGNYLQRQLSLYIPAPHTLASSPITRQPKASSSCTAPPEHPIAGAIRARCVLKVVHQWLCPQVGHLVDAGWHGIAPSPQSDRHLGSTPATACQPTFRSKTFGKRSVLNDAVAANRLLFKGAAVGDFKCTFDRLLRSFGHQHHQRFEDFLLATPPILDFNCVIEYRKLDEAPPVKSDLVPQPTSDLVPSQLCCSWSQNI
ncbi:hypothetical protein FA15DRAFT_733096 [Coprinopsis marcescibilis]|uniref:Uncharacterized protein n=1 Tax=Coprinopsis marcescibilis TaxID=230819 RepID=A0A5C3KCH6_COPMA|nr:hypothetical protein FA15DRAFT_733096 [Coprinopsis marcescibilis]